MKNLSKFVMPSLVLIFLILFSLFVYFGRQNYKKLDRKVVVEQSKSASIDVNVSQAKESTSSSIPKKESPNFLVDPGFETKETAWYSHENWKTNFKYDDKVVKNGKLSALLDLDSRQVGSQSTRVYGVVQDIKPTKFPEILSGNYYVDNWQKVTKKQYLQAVVIVYDPNNIPKDIAGGGNYQIRYVLAGASVAPLDIKNAKYIIVNPDNPIIGKWVHFERNLTEDFKKQWGDVPKNFSSIRVFFEARWDDRSENIPVVGRVHYDDLYLGLKAN